VAVGVAQLAAGILGEASSPLIAVGGAVVDASPEWLKSFAIQTFGTNDKAALLTGIGIVLALFAIALGAVSARRPAIGIVGLVAFGAVGALAAVTRPTNGGVDAIPSLAGTMAGAAAYLGLRRSGGLDHRSGAASGADRVPVPGDEGRSVFGRRRFLVAGAIAAGVAATTGLAGRALVRRAMAMASRTAVRIPRPADAAPRAPAGADLGIPGVGPFITPNTDFYRVDTALFVPAVDADTWKLSVHGMVDHPLSITYQELLARPLIERDVTLTCVSNRVGGRYIDNARWIGAPLKDLLDEAGVDPGATQIASRSADGFTVGTPASIALDGRDSMLAVGMNGEPLPLEHGFPVRMIVPGLYGYESATKWLVEIELTTFQSFTPYWVRRGWARQVLIHTESRIDTPRSDATLPAGTIPVGGIAWAQHRGIRAVDVRVDDGPWAPAELGAADTFDTWRQWLYRWDAVPGEHTLSARATDGTGAVQTAERRSPFPSGATGLHTIQVSVR
jgi:DMSO/TMAO reductase YedYZ molybdopterin-dependent catalytic subunit